MVRQRGRPVGLAALESVAEGRAGGLGDPCPALFGLEMTHLHTADALFGQELGEHVSHGSVLSFQGETGATSMSRPYDFKRT
jgi:hypothetical protein